MAGRSERRVGAIKPFRSQNRIDHAEAQRILDELRDAIGEMRRQNASALSYEKLYRNAYNLVLHKHGEKLYSGIEAEVTQYLRGLGAEVAQAPDETLLVELVDKWQGHITMMKMIRDILMYMDRTFVVQEKKEPVYELGLRIFRDEVTRHKNVKARVLKVVLDNIERERNGELIDRDVVRSVLQMQVDLGINSLQVYVQDFESEFLRVSRTFYKQEALQFVQVNTCPAYIVKAERRLEEERARALTYLHFTTEEKLERLVSEEMVVAHAAHLVAMPNSGCRVMLSENRMGDLGRMYRLFKFKNCREEIRNCMYDFIKETGEKLVSDEASSQKPVDFVCELLDLQAKFERIVKEPFCNDKSFQKAVKEAFEFFVNKNQRYARYLSMYLDELMRNKIKLHAQDDVELNQKVDRVVVLFRYLQDKDVFENFYKQQLAKRLLSGRSISDDAESSIIRKLKTECGYLFTSKLEGMFKDMRLSKEAMEKYVAAFPRQRNDDLSLELQVTVLTAGFWPTEVAPPCNLPQEVTAHCARFTRFYLECHNGRRLTWQTNLGSADIRARFSETVSHEFNVSTYQMCILLLFNSGREFTFQQIVNAVGVPEQDLKRHLISLAAPKFRVLNKVPKGRVIEADTRFAINDDFRSKHYRVRIPLVSARENLGTRFCVPEHVEEDRRHLVEAAIVRIMKARKVLEHNLLVAEVTKQMSVRFNPSPQQIKKRIESLIDREYLERNPQDLKTYRYLA